MGLSFIFNVKQTLIIPTTLVTEFSYQFSSCISIKEIEFLYAKKKNRQTDERVRAPGNAWQRRAFLRWRMDRGLSDSDLEAESLLAESGQETQFLTQIPRGSQVG